MSDKGRIQQGARFLFEDHQARKPFGPIPHTFAPRTVDEAYAIQEEFHTLLAGTQGLIAGYKIGLTTPVMQQMVGLNEPIAGAILANTIHQSPVSLRRKDYVHLGVECEIAVRFGADLPVAVAPFTRDSVADAVEAAMASFELIDDRDADYSKFAALALTCLADNAWNAGIVLGQPVMDWRKVDLATARGALTVNGEVVGEGRGSDVMGHPLEALVWLTNMLAKRGKGLTKGMIVMTGSIIATQFLEPGDWANLSVNGLGEVRLTVS
jgi:2-keto-4-pentenoate hydratase